MTVALLYFYSTFSSSRVEVCNVGKKPIKHVCLFNMTSDELECLKIDFNDLQILPGCASLHIRPVREHQVAGEEHVRADHHRPEIGGKN